MCTGHPLIKKIQVKPLEKDITFKRTTNPEAMGFFSKCLVEVFNTVYRLVWFYLAAVSSWPWLQHGGSRTQQRQSLYSCSCQQHWGKQSPPPHHLSPSSFQPGSPLSSWFSGCLPQTGGNCPHLHTPPGDDRS